MCSSCAPGYGRVNSKQCEECPSSRASAAAPYIHFAHYTLCVSQLNFIQSWLYVIPFNFRWCRLVILAVVMLVFAVLLTAFVSFSTAQRHMHVTHFKVCVGGERDGNNRQSSLLLNCPPFSDSNILHSNWMYYSSHVPQWFALFLLPLSLSSLQLVSFEDLFFTHIVK